MFVEHKEIGEVTEVPVKITKLSQAIREGAKKRPACKRAFFLDGRSCALGAAIEGLGYNPRDQPIIRGALAVCALPGASQLWQEILRRNDYDGESREAIADWLEAQGY